MHCPNIRCTVPTLNTVRLPQGPVMCLCHCFYTPSHKHLSIKFILLCHVCRLVCESHPNINTIPEWTEAPSNDNVHSKISPSVKVCEVAKIFREFNQVTKMHNKFSLHWLQASSLAISSYMPLQTLFNVGIFMEIY